MKAGAGSRPDKAELRRPDAQHHDEAELIRWVSVWRGCPGNQIRTGLAGIGSFLSATANRSRARFAGHDCSCWNAPRRPSPPPPSDRSPRRCSRSSALPQRDHQRTAARPHARGVRRRRAASGRAWARQRSRAAPRSPGSQSARRATRLRCCCSRGMRARAPGADGRRATPNRLPGP